MTSLEVVRSAAIDTVLDEVIAEIHRTDTKHGVQFDTPDGTGHIFDAAAANAAKAVTDAAFTEGRGTWRHILIEEVCEAFAETEAAPLRTELLQVAAVAIRHALAIDTRGALPEVAPATQEETSE